MNPLYEDEFTTIYCGRTEDLLPQLEQVDLVLTDPPYGLGKAWKRKYHGSGGKTRLWGEVPEWDKNPIDSNVVLDVVKKGKNAVIWGGNFYPLPPSRCWLVWDKMQSNYGADCELAWSNLDMAPKVFRMSRIAAYSVKHKAVFYKKHGAEKPVQLSEWVLSLTTPTSMLDCFMGTGNSLVAARARGIPSVGIDISEEYCKEAIKRIKLIKPESNMFSIKPKGFMIQGEEE